MHILLAGDFNHFFYEEICAQAWEKLQARVTRFAWGTRFPKGIIGQAQTKLMVGPAISLLNRELRKVAQDRQPDAIFIWRGNFIWPSTLAYLRRNTNALLVSYHNDNPFGLNRHQRFWSNFIRGIPQYDIHFVYRKQNLNDFINAGARQVYLLRSYYIPEIHHPVKLTDEEYRRFGCEVVFAGHYEPDGRVDYLNALAKAGVNLRLFGGTWERPEYLDDLRETFWPVIDIRGEDYVKALCGADMCLNFLSTINRDTYTRRCFEIPACGRLLVSQRTEDLVSLFRDNEEAVFFSSPEEMTDKVTTLLKDRARIQTMAEAGQQRCFRDKHDVYSRMQKVYQIFETELDYRRV